MILCMSFGNCKKVKTEQEKLMLVWIFKKYMIFNMFSSHLIICSNIDKKNYTLKKLSFKTFLTFQCIWTCIKYKKKKKFCFFYFEIEILQFYIIFVFSFYKADYFFYFYKID